MRQAAALPTPITERLDKALKAHRTQSGLRLENVAVLFGVAKQTLMKIEYGAGTANLNVLAKTRALSWPSTPGNKRAAMTGSDNTFRLRHL